MAKEYPVIAVIGTEECKKEMEQIQEKLTKQRHIVVPIGMCGKEDLDMRLDKSTWQRSCLLLIRQER